MGGGVAVTETCYTTSINGVDAALFHSAPEEKGTGARMGAIRVHFPDEPLHPVSWENLVSGSRGRDPVARPGSWPLIRRRAVSGVKFQVR